MDWIGARPIAHRGLHADVVPENSLAACRAAVEADYAIECDVRLTADGVPVVYHDEELGRLTDRSGAVRDLPADAVTDLGLDETDERIPSLDAVLDLVDGRVPLLIELKTEADAAPLAAAVVEVLDGYDGPFAIQSFDPRVLARVRRQRPAWPRGQLAGVPADVTGPSRLQRFALDRLLITWLSRPDFVAYEHSRLPYWPVSVHRRLGLPLLAWTVRTEDDFRRARRHADAVIFEGVRP